MKIPALGKFTFMKIQFYENSVLIKSELKNIVLI